jgi:hypothetical protein
MTHTYFSSSWLSVVKTVLHYIFFVAKHFMELVLQDKTRNPASIGQ